MKKCNSEAANDFKPLNSNDKNTAYTDGTRLQFCLDNSEIYKSQIFQKLVKSIQEQLRVLTGQYDYEVCNCVILNTTSIGERQQMHQDWRELAANKDEIFFVCYRSITINH